MKYLYIGYSDPFLEHHHVVSFDPKDRNAFKYMILDVVEPLLRMKPGFSIRLCLIKGDKVQEVSE